jgi:O-antigen/teichoic acid export membrane protein
MVSLNKYLNKIFNKVTSLKDLASVGIANVAGTLISGIFWLVLARLMDAEQYGEINYFIAIASVASAISFLGAADALMVFSAKKTRIESPLLIITTITSIICALVLFTLFSNIEISLYVIGYVIFNHLIYESLGRKLYPSFSKYFIIQRLLLVTFALGFFFLLGPMGVVLGYALSFFPFLLKIYKKYKISKNEFSLLKEKIPFMRDSYGLSLLIVTSGYVDKLIIAQLFGYSFLGNYQLSFQILMILTTISGIVFSYLLPQEASGKSHKKLWTITIFIVLVTSVLTIILAPSLLPILIPKYEPAIDLIQIMSIAPVFMTITLRYTSKFLSDEKSKIVVIGKAIYLSSHIIGIFSLGPIFGIQGVALSFVIASILEALYFMIINREVNKRQMDLNDK